MGIYRLETLVLKPRALVMFMVNKTERNWTKMVYLNGQVGTVVAICPSAMVVQQQTGGVVVVGRFTWRYDLQDHEPARFSQLPLRLGWGTTVHKTPRITLESACLDIRTAYHLGPACAAVSRVRSPEGLNFKEWFKGVRVSPEAVAFYEKLEQIT